MKLIIPPPHPPPPPSPSVTHHADVSPLWGGGEQESTATNQPIRASLYGAISQLPGLFLQLAPDLRQIAARDSIGNQPRLSAGGCLEGTEVSNLVGGRVVLCL